MVATITPVVYGPRLRVSWHWLTGIYSVSQVFGSTVTGVTIVGVGSLLGSFYSLSTPVVAVQMAAVGLIGALHDVDLLPFRLPSFCWQVPDNWKRLRPTAMAASYGFVIGLGVLTRIRFGSFYVLLVACAALASPPWGVAFMALYGASRAAALATVAFRQGSVRDPDDRLRSIIRLSPLIAYLDGIALALVTGFFLGDWVLNS